MKKENLQRLFKAMSGAFYALDDIGAAIVARRFTEWVSDSEVRQTGEDAWDWPDDIEGGAPELAIFRALCAMYEAIETEDET